MWGSSMTAGRYLNHKYAFGSLLFLLLTSCRAETLKELLVSNQVPLASFQPSDLQQTVQGSAAADERQVVLAYQTVNAKSLLGHPHLIRYSKTSGKMSSFGAPADRADICLGSIETIHLVGGFTLVSTSVSPSAECMWVFDSDLKPRQTLFGFGPVEVEPQQIVFIENMIHFAPVHPERLQFADLVSGKTAELYPPKGDALRDRLITEHEKHMPAQATCAHNNDPCEPDKFDEDIRSTETDGKGTFAFVAVQSANHAFNPDEDPVTVVSQSVLYIYKRESDGWRYCEQEVSGSEVEIVQQSLRSDFAKVRTRCTPTLPVVPEMSTAEYNPFMSR